MRFYSPRNTKPATKGGVGVPTSGEYQYVAVLILPENLNRCKPFFGNGGGLSNRLWPSGGLPYNPNGEAMSLATTLPAHLRPRREKLFGDGRPRPLDRNAKARVMTFARALMRRTEKGKAYGQITAKALAVLEALLWGFHNARSGLCFPSYETIAERAGCARSTVAEALKALEDAGLAVMGESHQACPGALRRPVRALGEPGAGHSHQQRLSVQ